jgi:hypothetical protein
LLTQGKINKCLYIVNGQDLAIGRRIYTGMDDEKLKAIEWIKRSSGYSISMIFDIGANIGIIVIPY